ncbi:CAZyme family CE5 [Paecilomyces variotii]|nr:CAZyme family CE5 [Paecilomyces variotii]
MVAILRALSIGLTTGHAVWATQITERTQSCSSVHFFLARGTSEPYPGTQGQLVNATCSQLSNCDYEDIIYPATSNSTDGFCWSVESGVQNGTQQLIDYANRCPDSKLVISGYSQGAQVVTDILGGGGGQLWDLCKQSASAALDTSTNASRNLAAAIVFGDTRHTANQSYNLLSGWDINGYAIRTQNMLDALDVYASRIRSYCDKNDPICCRGHDLNTHLTYLTNYTDDAASWLVSTINKATIP